MTTQAKKVVKIKPLEGYTAMSDADIVQRGTAAQTGLTGNSNFQNLPVDLAVLKTDIESLSALIAESLDGSKKVIAQKNKQREAVPDNSRTPQCSIRWRGWWVNAAQSGR